MPTNVELAWKVNLFTIIGQATKQILADSESDLSGNCFVGNSQHVQALNCYTDKIKLAKNCGTATGCFYNDGTSKPYKYLNGADYSNIDTIPAGKAILSIGMSIRISDMGNDCGASQGIENFCAEITVDINGINRPNVLGRDVFVMYVTKDGVVHQWGMSSDYKTLCRPSESSSGSSCLGRILLEGDMNY